MKFSTTFVFAAGALAQLQQPTRVTRSDATLVDRDVATISQVVVDVGNAMVTLDTAVKGFTATDANSLVSLNNAANQVTQVLKDGTTKVQATSNISLSDAITLQSQVGGLQTTGNSLITDLTSKKSEVEKAGLCDIVLQQVTGVSDNAKSLINAVISKVPEAAQSIAQQQVSGFTNSLQSVQGVFSQGNCTNQGSAAGGAAGATIAATTAPNATTTRGTATTTSRPTTFTGAAALVTAAAGPVGAFAVAMAAAML